MKYISCGILLSLLSLSLNSSEIVRHAHGNFMIHMHDNKTIAIPHYQVSKPIRALSPEKLAAVLNSGSRYLTINELSDGSYALDMQGRLPGSGVIGAALGTGIGTAIVFIGGHGVMFLTRKTIGAFAGKAAEAEFADKIHTRFAPKINEAAVYYGGQIGFVVGGAFPI